MFCFHYSSGLHITSDKWRLELKKISFPITRCVCVCEYVGPLADTNITKRMIFGILRMNIFPVVRSYKEYISQFLISWEYDKILAFYCRHPVYVLLDSSQFWIKIIVKVQPNLYILTDLNIRHKLNIYHRCLCFSATRIFSVPCWIILSSRCYQIGLGIIVGIWKRQRYITQNKFKVNYNYRKLILVQHLK